MKEAITECSIPVPEYRAISNMSNGYIFYKISNTKTFINFDYSIHVGKAQQSKKQNQKRKFLIQKPL